MIRVLLEDARARGLGNWVGRYERSLAEMAAAKARWAPNRRTNRWSGLHGVCSSPRLRTYEREQAEHGRFQQ